VSFDPIPEEIEAIGLAVIQAAAKIHSTFGPGLLESAYKAFLVHELTNRGHTVRVEVPIPVVFEGVRLECGYRIDILVDDLVIIEVKAQSMLDPSAEAQLLTYLKLSGRRLGYLLNFHVRLMKQGITRRVL